MRGARVVEFAGSIAGAYCAKLLATSGADVVLVEPPDGSPLRLAEPRLDVTGGPARGALHEYLAAGRRSVVLPDEDALTDLLAWADVVVSSSERAPAAVLARQERVRAANPAAVHVVVSGYGLTGPWSAWRRSALTDWAAGGHLSLTGRPEREPLQGGGPWDSYLHGATAAVGAEAGLIEAARTGEGCLVDVGAMEALAAAHQWSIVMYTHTGVVKGRWGNRLGESHHPMALFPTRAGWVCIGAASLEQWEHFCITTGAVELLADERLYAPAERFDRADEIDAYLLPWLASRTAEEAVEELQSNRVPAGKVLDFAELLDEAQLRHRGFWAEPAHLGPAARMPAAPFRVGPFPDMRPAPAPGEHTAEVLAEARTARAARAGGGGGRPSPPGLDLRGVRVVEFSVAWAGPLTGRFLADLGADVIKVEHPTARGLGVSAGGDAAPPPWTWGTLPDPQVRASIFPNADPSGRWWNRMGHWNKMNRGKRSLALDAKAPGGEEVLRRLLEEADVVLQNYTPRGARSLGIDRERVAALNPRAITVAMSGYGETGPMASHASWGPILEAHSGFDEATGYLGDGEGPTRIGVAYPDAVGGVHGAVAVLAALWERELTGRGQHVDLSQLESLVAMAGELVLATSVTGRPPTRHGNRSLDHAPQGVYRCAGDDAWVALTVGDDDAWAGLVELVDRPGLRGAELATEPARRRAHDHLDAELSAWSSGWDKFAAAEALQAAGVAAAPVMTNRDLVESRQLAARRFMVTWDQPDVGELAYPGYPYLVDGAPRDLRRAPTLGEHNDEVLGGLLGLSADDVAALAAAGTIATAPPA